MPVARAPVTKARRESGLIVAPSAVTRCRRLWRSNILRISSGMVRPPVLWVGHRVSPMAGGLNLVAEQINVEGHVHESRAVGRYFEQRGAAAAREAGAAAVVRVWRAMGCRTRR